MFGLPTPNILAPCKNKRESACTWQRIGLPLDTLQEMGLATPLYDDGINVDPQAREDAEFAWYYLLIDDLIAHRMADAKRRGTVWSPYGPKPRQTTIYSLDDSIEHVSIFNPRFGRLGTQMPDGRPVAPGSVVEADFGSGQRQVLWRDGQRIPEGIMSLEDNHRRLDLYKQLLRDADGVVVTTQALGDLIRSYGAQNVFVYPNVHDPRDFPEDIHLDRSKTRILWQGGHSHFTDWQPIAAAVGRAIAKRPNVELVVFGQMFPALQRAVPAKQLRHIPWGSYDRYSVRLATIGHQINLAPLSDDTFNLYKSPLKMTESARLGNPAATLASDHPVYRQVIEPGKTGWLAKSAQDWETRLLHMIDNHRETRQLAKAARAQTISHLSPESHTLRLFEWLMATREALKAA